MMVQDRETSLVADNLEYANALASVQRELEEKDVSFRKLKADRAWFEADNLSLKEELRNLSHKTKYEKENVSLTRFVETDFSAPDPVRQCSRAGSKSYSKACSA
jgi:peptidoglycan hydrolase CwlO-like protein